jgi:hypothetical protein
MQVHPGLLVFLAHLVKMELVLPVLLAQRVHPVKQDYRG